MGLSESWKRYMIHVVTVYAVAHFNLNLASGSDSNHNQVKISVNIWLACESTTLGH